MQPGHFALRSALHLCDPSALVMDMDRGSTVCWESKALLTYQLLISGNTSREGSQMREVPHYWLALDTV